MSQKVSIFIFKADDRYFPIGQYTEEEDQRMLDVLIQQLLDEAEVRRNKSQARMYEVYDRNIPQELTPWLRRTGWIHRFDGKNMKVLHDLLKYTTNDDSSEREKLQLVCNSVDRIIEKCWTGVKDLEDRNWRLILYWLNTAKWDEQNQSPFRIHMDKKTRQSYGIYWQQFMVFVLQGFEDPEKYGIEYTMVQQSILAEVKNELDQEEPDEEKLETLILKLSLLFIQHDNFEKERSALLYYLGIMGYHIELKRWRRPEEYTNILAALQWVIRVLVLEFTLPTEERDDWKILHLDNPLSHFKQSHIYLVEGESYPFDEIHKLLNYGMKSSKNAQSRSRMSWSPDGKYLLLDGRRLSMNAWKKFVHELLGQAESMLSKNLLFREDGQLPSIDLHYWNDNQCNSQPGYYFILEESDAEKKSQERLIKVLKRSSKWKHMLDHTPDDLRFNPEGIKDYMERDVQFRKLLLLIITITCGLSGRAPEMMSMKYMNTSMTPRHFVLLHGQFMAITEYHKSQAVQDILKVCLFYYKIDFIK
jgi:hypothetical protein